jgi:ubiquinone/menaquinone biosynthesis C-methylase UbiE
MKMNVNKSNNIWDKVAPNFGKVGPKYWEKFGERLVEHSKIDKGARVLDIGMGRGASLFPEINKVGEEGYVIGIDNSEVMVNETYKDIIQRNIGNAEVQVMNAQHLKFEENYFDNVVCGFGLGYLLLSEDKLNGVLRVLKNGGQAAFSIWGVQEDQKWLTRIVNKYLPQVGQEKNKGKLDIPKFSTVEDVVQIFSDFGFINVKVFQENTQVIYKDKDEWWEEMCTNAVCGIFEQIEARGRNVFEEFKKDIFMELEGFNIGSGFCFNMPVIYAFGDK